MRCVAPLRVRDSHAPGLGGWLTAASAALATSGNAYTVLRSSQPEALRALLALIASRRRRRLPLLMLLAEAEGVGGGEVGEALPGAAGRARVGRGSLASALPQALRNCSGVTSTRMSVKRGSCAGRCSVGSCRTCTAR